MRVLFVCTANVCRSRVAEGLFRELTRGLAGHEARSAGIRAVPEGRQLGPEDLEWADVVCVMEPAHAAWIERIWPPAQGKVRVLGIPDRYGPDDPVLASLLTTHILALLAEGPGAR